MDALVHSLDGDVHELYFGICLHALIVVNLCIFSADFMPETRGAAAVPP